MRVRLSKSFWKYALALPLLAGGGVLVHAQIEGPKRGIPPIASSGDFEVTGVIVNATGKNADEARRAGWEEAQRKAWEQLGGPAPFSKADRSRFLSALDEALVRLKRIG